MKTKINLINKNGDIELCAEFINNNSAKVNLVNYFLSNSGDKMYEIEARNNFNEKIAIINNRTAIFEDGDLIYTAIRINVENKIIPSSDDHTDIADKKSEMFYFNRIVIK